MVDWREVWAFLWALVLFSLPMGYAIAHMAD